MSLETISKITKKLKKIEKKKNTVYLNEKDTITFRPKQTMRIGIFGSSGGGKSYSAGIIAGQFKNVIMLDPNGRPGFIETLEEQDQDQDWEFFVITKERNAHSLKINVKEFNINCLNLICSTKSSDSHKIRKFLQSFVSMRRENKNFEDFKAVCEEKKLDDFLYEMKAIFDENDKGMEISEIIKGKKLIDINELGSQNRAVAILLEAIYSFKRSGKENLKIKRENLLIMIDDAQESCVSYTAVGEAFARLGGMARKHKIHLAVVTAHQGRLATKLKSQFTWLLIFPTQAEIETIRKTYGINIDSDSFENLPNEEGWCIFHYHKNPNKDRIIWIDGEYWKKLFNKVEFTEDEPNFFCDKKAVSFSE